MLHLTSYLYILLYLSVTTYGIQIPIFLQEYIQRAIKNATNNGLLTELVNPLNAAALVGPIKCPQPENYVLLPIWLWDPVRLAKNHGSITLERCPAHENALLRLSRWMNGSKAWQCPRVLHSPSGPILLVGCDYYCAEGQHYIRSTDNDILSALSEHFDTRRFVLSYRSGYTRDFVEELKKAVSSGVSFSRFAAAYIEKIVDLVSSAEARYWNDLAHFRDRLQHNESSSNPIKESSSKAESLFLEMLELLQSCCPCDGTLVDLFLKDFQLNKALYEQEMRSSTARALMADHTFKVSLNIGAQRDGDNSWNKQYSSLFVVLNEEHLVVSWQLAEKEKFDVIKELLTNLKTRLDDHDADVRFFIIDNCCKWRHKIQELFGENVIVLLDLFHAVQRITSTMNKRHSLFNDCVKELKLVFRDRHDTGDKRTTRTPEKEIISQNLDRFVEKWSHIARTSQAGGDDLFRANFLQHIKNLKEHISSGCLSGIPPGYSTSINESLHEKLNDLFAGAKMGPELALALLTIFFYSWNSKRKNKIRGIGIIKPLSSFQAEQAKCRFKENRVKETNTVSKQPNETFGIGVSENRKEDASSDNSAKGDSIHSKLVSQIFNAVRNKAALAKNLLCTPNGIYDFYLLPSVFHQIMKSTLTAHAGENSKETAQATLLANIAAKGFKIVTMPANGDCLFHSISFALSQVIQSKHDDVLLQHLNSLGINGNTSTHEMSILLRKLMVLEWKKDEQLYKQMLIQEMQDTFLDTVDIYLKPGEYSGDLGDLMLSALVNALKVPVYLLTSIENFPVTSIFPKNGPISSNTIIYLAFTGSGSGHYDALVEVEKGDSKALPTKCSCGKNNSDGKRKCCTDQNTQYKVRCPCFNSMEGCIPRCRCKGCSNPYGVKNDTGLEKTVINRKRKATEMGGMRVKGQSFLEKEGEQMKIGRWTDLETVILLEATENVIGDIKDLTVPKTDQLEQLVTLYNDVISLAKSHGCMCNKKEKDQN